MRAIFSILLGLLFCCPIVRSQASSTDTKALQAILEEVRQLRRDLHTTAATVQRAQIVLYRLRLQTDVISRLTQKLDESHTRVEQLKSARIQTAAHIKTNEDLLESTQDPSARKQIEDVLAATKTHLENMANQEQEYEAKQSEQTSQLRLEQAKLEDLEAQLEKIQKTLEVGAPPGSPN
jgi:hypothetical protein